MSLNQNPHAPKTPSDVLGPAPDPQQVPSIIQFRWTVQGGRPHLVSANNYAERLGDMPGMPVYHDPADQGPLTDNYQMVNVWHPYLTDEEITSLKLNVDPRRGRPRSRRCLATPVMDPEVIQQAIDDLSAQMNAEVNEDIRPFQPGPNTVFSIQCFTTGLNNQGNETLMTNYGTGLWDRTGLIVFPHRESRVQLKIGWQMVAMDILGSFTFTFTRGATSRDLILPVIIGLSEQLRAINKDSES